MRKLYVWTENVLQDYSSGMIVCLAESLDDAYRLAQDEIYPFGSSETSEGHAGNQRCRDRLKADMQSAILMGDGFSIIDLGANACRFVYGGS